MNDKRQSSDNDDDNFLDPRQSHFRLLSNNQYIFILPTSYLYYTSILHICCKHVSIHFYCKYFLYSRSFHICLCLISGVQDDTRYDTGETEGRRYLLLANASYLPVSLFITPSSLQSGPGYQMSGLGFLLICRGRSRANICFIFHSF